MSENDAVAALENLAVKDAVILDSTPVVFEGLLSKHPRNRTIFYLVADLLISDRFKDRTIKIHESGDVQYWDGGDLKGGFSLLGAKVGPLALDGKVGGISIGTKSGENVQLAASSIVERDTWIMWMTAVAEGKALLIKSLAALGAMLGLEAGKKFSLVCDDAALTKCLIASSYTADRFAEVFYTTYFENFLGQLKSLLDADATLIDCLRAKLEGKLEVCIKLAEDTSNWSSGYYRTSITECGVLTIEIKSASYVWCNINTLGSDLCQNMGPMPSGLPYECDFSVRNSQPAHTAHCNSIDALLGTTGMSFDLSLETHYLLLKPNSYDNSRLGEIFCEMYPENIVAGFKSAVAASPDFAAKFLAKNTRKRIVLRSNPAMEGHYHEVSFDDDGSCVVVFKSLYTSVYEISEKIETFFQDTFKTSTEEE
jgi:hypothetical protein